MQKFSNPALEEQIVTYIRNTGMLVAIDYVAQKFGLAWGTARAILLELVVKGKIKCQKTTKSLIFWV